MENSHFTEMNSSFQGPYVDYYHLLMEMRTHNFDVIRFATYRAASKLRFIQKRTSLHLVDIWNMIEAFRENGLNTLEPRMEINVSRLETLVSSIYYQLNKRLSASQQLDIDQSSSLLLSWLLATYDPDETGKVFVFSIKIALATLSTGKLTDKLRYIFSLISDANGHLIYNKFAEFLKEILALPCSVFESPSFCYDDNLAGTIFDKQTKVTVNDFLDALMSDPGPQCLTWLPLLHRMANVENELHPVLCDGCNRESFLGFRYKCQRCYNYQLCQDCFWRGRVSGSHTNQHEMKEYTTYKPPSKQISHSLRKSFKCVPEKQSNQLPRFPDEPERPLNLQHIIPPSPLPSHNGFHDPLGHSFDMSSLDSRSTSKSPLHQTSSLESSRDDEHRLIVRYAARLADSRGGSIRSPSELSISMDSCRQKDLILQLEAKNREIMKEIIRLRKQQEQEDAALQSEQNPTLLAELRALRQRKEELETHLSTLQESRRELMVQLESLMKLLKIKTEQKTSRHHSGRKVKGLTNRAKESEALVEKLAKGETKMNHQASPRSTPNSSPRSGTSKSPPLSTPYPLSSSRSAPTTPGSGAPTTDSLTGVGGDVRMAFGQTGSTRSLRNDLLVAADSVTNAMSSLVRELNSGSEDEDGGADSKVLSSSRDFETEDTESAVESLEGGGTLWREERQRKQESEFLAEIRARNLSSTTTNNARESEITAKTVKTTTEEEDKELYDNDPRKVSVVSS